MRVAIARLQCPQLQSLTVRGMRGYSWMPGTWQLPPSLVTLVLEYDMEQVELVCIMSQLPVLHHLVMRGNKQPHVQLALPQLHQLEYEISAPNLCVDAQHCPNLRTVELRTISRRALPMLKLPPTVPVVRVHGRCRIDVGLPSHVRWVR
jgi:hypothetical protein